MGGPHPHPVLGHTRISPDRQRPKASLFQRNCARSGLHLHGYIDGLRPRRLSVFFSPQAAPMEVVALPHLDRSVLSPTLTLRVHQQNLCQQASPSSPSPSPPQAHPPAPIHTTSP